MAKDISKGKSAGRKPSTIDDLERKVRAHRKSIKSLLEGGKLENLKELEINFTSAVADELGINHSRLIDKLSNPVKFTCKEIYKIAFYTDTDPMLILKQISKEIPKDKKAVDDLKKFKSIRTMKKYKNKRGK